MPVGIPLKARSIRSTYGLLTSVNSTGHRMPTVEQTLSPRLREHHGRKVRNNGRAAE